MMAESSSSSMRRRFSLCDDNGNSSVNKNKKRRSSQSDIEEIQRPSPLTSASDELPAQTLTFALHQVSDPVIIFERSLNNPPLRINFVNSSFEEIVGLSKVQLLGSLSIPFIKQEDQPYFIKTAFDCSDEATYQELEVLNMKNSYRTMMKISFIAFGRTTVICTLKKICHIIPTQSNTHSPISNSSSLETFLEEKEKQITQLRERLEIFQNFFEHCPCQMALIELPDPKSGQHQAKTLLANRLAASGIYGRNPDGNLGVAQDEILAYYAQEAQRTHCPVFFESTPAGSSAILSSKIKYLKANNFMCFSTEITRNKKLEAEIKKNKEELEVKIKNRTQEIEQALQLKSRFLAVMSHEIRTPLSGILGMLSLLTETSLTTDQREMVKTAHICGEQLLVVINDILDLTKMDENKMLLEAVPFSLSTVLEESLEVVSFDSEKKKIELICDIENDLHNVVEGDAARLRQVIVNLLSNAIKFSKEGEVVISAKCKDLLKTATVTTSSTSSGFSLNGLSDGSSSSPNVSASTYCEILFSVKDSGIGIPESAKSTIFQPFNQADSSVTRNYGGSGLGLCISKQLAKLMGGDMWFDSQEGQGSTFYFTIVVKKCDMLTSSVVSSIPLLTSFQKRVSEDFCNKRIALVEPNLTLRKVLKRKLESWSLVTTSFATCEEVLQVCRKGRNGGEIPLFHAALIDSRQPPEAIEKVLGHMPAVLLGSIEGKLRSLPVVKKPVRELALLSRFNQVLRPNDPRANLAELLAQAPLTLPAESSLSILVAEDNLANQAVIRKLLQTNGYHNVEIVDNGKKAIDLLRSSNKKFHLILMDVMMPVMGGLEATETIRKEFDGASQPIIIALTANAFAEDHKRCLLSGMNGVLTKPINKKALLETLQQCNVANDLEYVGTLSSITPSSSLDL